MTLALVKGVQPVSRSVTPPYCLNPSVYESIEGNYRSAVASADIAQGETIVLYGGGFVDRKNIQAVPQHIRPYFYQVADGIWYGHGLTEAGLGAGDRINHSCSPNAGFAGISQIIAIRNIKAGEQITLDYAGIQSEDLDGSEFDCKCGASNCRGVVGIRDWVNLSKKPDILPYAQPYIQAKLARGNSSIENSSIGATFGEFRFPDGWHNPIRNGELQPLLVSDAVNIKPNGWILEGALNSGDVVALSGGMTIPANRPDFSGLFELGRSSLAGYDLSSSQAHLHLAPLLGPDSPANLSLRLGHVLVANSRILSGQRLGLEIFGSPSNLGSVNNNSRWAANIS